MPFGILSLAGVKTSVQIFERIVSPVSLVVCADIEFADIAPGLVAQAYALIRLRRRMQQKNHADGRVLNMAIALGPHGSMSVAGDVQ